MRDHMSKFTSSMKNYKSFGKFLGHWTYNSISVFDMRVSWDFGFAGLGQTYLDGPNKRKKK